MRRTANRYECDMCKDVLRIRGNVVIFYTLQKLSADAEAQFSFHITITIAVEYRQYFLYNELREEKETKNHTLACNFLH